MSAYRSHSRPTGKTRFASALKALAVIAAAEGWAWAGLVPLAPALAAAPADAGCPAAWISSVADARSELRFLSWEVPPSYQAYAMAGTDPSADEWEPPEAEGEGGGDPRYRFEVGAGWVYVVVAPQAIPQLRDYAIRPLPSPQLPPRDNDSKAIGPTTGPVPARLRPDRMPGHWQRLSLPSKAMVCSADF